MVGFGDLKLRVWSLLQISISAARAWFSSMFLGQKCQSHGVGPHTRWRDPACNRSHLQCKSLVIQPPRIVAISDCNHDSVGYQERYIWLSTGLDSGNTPYGTVSVMANSGICSGHLLRTGVFGPCVSIMVYACFKAKMFVI